MKVNNSNKASKSFYRLLKTFMGIKSARLKAAALLGAHLLRRRYISVYLDPVIACNIRCRMCYFSDEKSRPRPVGILSPERLSLLRKALFSRALKLQIGCGAEPSLYASLPQLVREAKEAGIPYVEMTTNGQLLDYGKLNELVGSGLDGITLSLHGTTRSTYEYLMDGARFEKLKSLIDDIANVQAEHPAFSLRINYTFNRSNYKEIPGIFDLFAPVGISVLQLRPIQNLGDTAYSDFNLDDIVGDYNTIIAPMRQKSRELGVTFLAPDLGNLKSVDDKCDYAAKMIEEISYCYVSPVFCYKDDFDLSSDTFESYWKRHGLATRLLRTSIAGVASGASAINTTKKMNYTVD